MLRMTKAKVFIVDILLHILAVNMIKVSKQQKCLKSIYFKLDISSKRRVLEHFFLFKSKLYSSSLFLHFSMSRVIKR